MVPARGSMRIKKFSTAPKLSQIAALTSLPKQPFQQQATLDSGFGSGDGVIYPKLGEASASQQAAVSLYSTRDGSNMHPAKPGLTLRIHVQPLVTTLTKLCLTT